jgi:hypothetical protein
VSGFDEKGGLDLSSLGYVLLGSNTKLEKELFFL